MRIKPNAKTQQHIPKDNNLHAFVTIITDYLKITNQPHSTNLHAHTQSSDHEMGVF